jgi:hypothetical protein
MKRIVSLSFAALLAACSSAPADSTPVISGLTFTSPTIAPGQTEVGTFYISNAAGFDGLSFTLHLSAPGGVTTSATPMPLTMGGVPGTMQASGGFEIPLPAAAPAGTYTVTITVSDGPDTSNELTGSFTVS